MKINSNASGTQTRMSPIWAILKSKRIDGAQQAQQNDRLVEFAGFVQRNDKISYNRQDHGRSLQKNNHGKNSDR